MHTKRIQEVVIRSGAHSYKAAMGFSSPRLQTPLLEVPQEYKGSEGQRAGAGE
jgi:hypothetical protein